MQRIIRHKNFSPIFTRRFINDIFFYISSQIGRCGNPYNTLFFHKKHLIFTNEKIRRDYESGNLRKINNIFRNFIHRLVLTGLDNFITNIDLIIKADIFDNKTTVYDIDGPDHETLIVSNIHEIKKILKHLMCCKKNLNLLIDLVKDNFENLFDHEELKKLRPNILSILKNLNKCVYCNAFSYTEGDEKAAAIIQNNYLYYRDTPVDLKSPNIEKTLWWKIHTQRLQDIYHEYGLELK